MREPHHDRKTKQERRKARAAALWHKIRHLAAHQCRRVRRLAEQGLDAVSVKAAEGWRKAGEVFGKVRVAVARHPVSPLLYVTALAVALGAFTFQGMYTRAYVLNVDGQEVGVIATQEELDDILNHVETRVSSILGEDFDYEADITLTPAFTAADEFTDAAEVEETLFSGVGALVDAWAISVDGRELGYAATREELQGLLDEIAAPYLNENVIDYSFVEEVALFPVELPANTEYDLDSLRAVLTSHTVEEARYTIQRGDTFNAIAYSLGLTPAELQELNPEVEPSKLFVDQELIVQEEVPYLSVRTVADEQYEQVLESPVEYIETPDLYIGSTSVKERGTDGLADVNAHVTYVNGKETEREVITSETLVEPTTTYVYTGTTPKPLTASNGYYIWPVQGTITSGYGYRILYGVSDFHLGLDIACPYGTTVKAADGGTVTYSGWQGSYGLLVVITHDNGNKTYYAHNSSLLVSVGDKVYQGQAIARVGMTGSASGYHCHFEIRINGHTVNPLNYL